MFWFKACSRCGGDLFEDTDIHGPFIACLRCSHYLTEIEEAHLGLLPSSEVAQLFSTIQKEKVAI